METGGEPSYHTARRKLEDERQPYNRKTVNALQMDGWGVYAIWGGPYECLYIGKSAFGESVKGRLQDHLSRQEPNPDLKRTLYLLRNDVEFAICLTGTAEWASNLEDRLIKHYQPQCNRQQLS